MHGIRTIKIIKNLLTIALLSLSISYGNAQNLKHSEVPQVVKTAFAKSYPLAKEVKLTREDGEFEASFDENKKDYQFFMMTWVSSRKLRQKSRKNELPKLVHETFVGWKIEESAKIVANGATTYEAEVEKGEKII